jgi:ACS family glucarate transporter-like MFS transporter
MLAGFWRWLGSDSPEKHRYISPVELKRIGENTQLSGPSLRVATPWRALLTSRSTWCLALSYGVGGYPSYVFFTWFFLYLVNVRQVDIRAGGYWSALPYVAIAVMVPLGGRLTDRLTSRWGKRRGRLTVVLAGAAAATTLILVGVRVPDARLAVVLLSLGAGCHLAAQTPSWAASIDLAPSHSATLFGIMNTMAQAFGALAPVLTPFIAARLGWVVALDFAAFMAAVTGVLWLFVRPEKPIG